MGSKNYMLSNGLGNLIIDQSKHYNTFFDLFCGSASVTWFAAKNIKNKIISGDLQSYSVNLANAVLLRNKPIIYNKLILEWISNAKNLYPHRELDMKTENQIDFVLNARKYCKRNSKNGIITKSYGGYYFSKEQSLMFDYLLKTIPEREPYKSIAKSALIIAASNCAASPGHTAQPFQPTKSSIKYIYEAWNKDVFLYIQRSVKDIFEKFANERSKAYTLDATKLTDKVKEGDLVFLDPPYSGVHYSRFYHVLETISRGKCSKVFGRGRYPIIEERPKSEFSLRSGSINELNNLLKKISEKKASAIITFPAGECSNGLSGDLVKTISKKYFKVKKDIIKGRFSTLGGNKINRPARKESAELILLLEPK